MLELFFDWGLAQHHLLFDNGKGPGNDTMYHLSNCLALLHVRGGPLSTSIGINIAEEYPVRHSYCHLQV